MEIRVPEIGESVHDALLAKWFKNNGDVVRKDEAICELETDKITLDLNADQDGILAISTAEGETVKVGAVIGSIAAMDEGIVQPSLPTVSSIPDPSLLEEQIKSTVSSPAARREMREEGIAPDSVIPTGKGGRITLDDLFNRIETSSRRATEHTDVSPSMGAGQVVAEVTPLVESAVAAAAVSGAQTVSRLSVVQVPTAAPAFVRSEEAPQYNAAGSGRREERKPMTPIRRRIAERLLAARQQTAMLTTFNEADLSHVKLLREKYSENFYQRHGISLGYMPFFVKACIEALRDFPAVNASIEGNDIVYHHFYDIGIAISGEKGLVVPILRNADQMKIHEIDQAISAFSEKIAGNRLAISDLEGGTFTISNGGVFGSMLSTPILNPPQSGILGMHAIQDRPVVRDGQIVIRPMMYLALSYDHRIIDGHEAVGFLRRVKGYIENPEELLLES